ncbi:MAG TPA: hypothetical protein PLY87_18390 [Planctomycetaceae bacterium]|nr:hypothetical protein [Planctomycetaceae bacterium]
MTVEQGQIIFLNFPFSDGSGTKVRPAAVLKSNRENQPAIGFHATSINGRTRIADAGYELESTYQMFDPNGLVPLVKMTES